MFKIIIIIIKLTKSHNKVTKTLTIFKMKADNEKKKHLLKQNINKKYNTISAILNANTIHFVDI